MKQEVKSKLLGLYSQLNSCSPKTALKFRFQYNMVNVNLYFDAYDNESPSLSMILEYNKKYYYTSLNIKNNKIIKEFLAEIPSDILEKILNSEYQLDDFFSAIEAHILFGNFIVINYQKDIMFVNTMKYSNENRKDLPFLMTIKKTRMQDKTLYNLSQTMGIDEGILRKIQNENMTLVRTDNPDRRKKLIAILQGTKIRID